MTEGSSLAVLGAVPSAPEGDPSSRGKQDRHSSVSVASRLLRGASWSTLAQLLPVVTSIVMTPFVLHHLGLEQYGLFTLATLIVGFLRTFDGGLGSTALRFFSIQAGQDRRADTTRLLTALTLVVLVVGSVVCAAFYLLAPYLLQFLGASDQFRAEAVFLLRTLTVILVPSLITGMFGAVLAARQRYARITGVSVVSTVAGTVATYLVLRHGEALRAIALILAAQCLFTLLAMIASAAPFLDRRALRPASRPEIRDFFHYASRVQLVSFGAVLSLETDSIIVGASRGPRSVGLYSLGAGFALQLRNVVINALGPITSHLGARFGAAGDEARHDFENLQRIWVVGTTGWCAAGVGSGYVAITAWLGPQFGVAGTVATVLALSNMINLWTGVTTAWLQTLGHPGVEARYTLLSFVINAVLTAALVYPLGLYGIMIGTAVGQTIASLYLLRVIRQRVPETVRSFLLEVPVVSGLLCAAITLGLEFLIGTHVPHGPIGLLSCGGLALPGLAVFAYRERWLVNAVRAAR